MSSGRASYVSPPADTNTSLMTYVANAEEIGKVVGGREMLFLRAKCSLEAGTRSRAYRCDLDMRFCLEFCRPKSLDFLAISDEELREKLRLLVHAGLETEMREHFPTTQYEVAPPPADGDDDALTRPVFSRETGLFLWENDLLDWMRNHVRARYLPALLINMRAIGGAKVTRIKSVTIEPVEGQAEEEPEGAPEYEYEPGVAPYMARARAVPRERETMTFAGKVTLGEPSDFVTGKHEEETA